MPRVRAHNYVIQTNFRLICCPEIYTSHCLKLVAVQIGHFSHSDADISLELLQKRAIPLSRNKAYCLLQECEGKQNLDYGRIVQFLVVHSGLDSTAVLGDHLIRVFTRHGSLLEAHQAFSKIAQPSVYTWTEVVMANAKLGQTAIDLYEKMYESAERSDKHIYVAILKACLKRKALFQTRIIHEQIILDGFTSDLIISNTLIKAYAKCGSIEEAYKVFAILPNRDIVTWNAVIAAHAQHGDVLLALTHFEKMQREGGRYRVRQGYLFEHFKSMH